MKADIRALRRTDREREDVELIILELKNQQPVLLYCCYHPGTASEPLIELNSALLETRENSCNIVAGDFNLLQLDWSKNCTAPVK